MDYVKKRTHIVSHPRFLKAGAIARDLYDWGMLHSGLIESDGVLEMVAVLASPWGYGGKANIRAAQKLVEVGLWERIDEGFRILKWAEQGNVTKSELEEKRKVDRERKRTQRGQKAEPGSVSGASPRGGTEGERGGARRESEGTSAGGPSSRLVGSDGVSPMCPTGTPSGIATSTSTSTSLGSSSGGSAEGAGPPEWFLGAVASAEMAGTPVDQVPARWASYRSSRKRKSWAMNHEDAVGWLCDVIRGERARRPAPRPDTRQPLLDPANAPWLKASGGDL